MTSDCERTEAQKKLAQTKRRLGCGVSFYAASRIQQGSPAVDANEFDAARMVSQRIALNTSQVQRTPSFVSLDC